MGLFGMFPSSKYKSTVPGMGRKAFRGGTEDHHYLRNDAMEKLQSDPRIRRILNTKKEQAEFFRALHDAGQDRRGVTGEEIVGILSKKYADPKDRFTKREVLALGEAFNLPRWQLRKIWTTPDLAEPTTDTRTTSDPSQATADNDKEPSQG